MTREEAIEVVKKNWPDSRYTCLREALEFLIPELRESEDERIRKGIIEIIKAVSGPDCDVYLDEKKQEKYIAWLEKQKEQKLDGLKEDYSGMDDVERIIHRGFLAAGVENVPVTIIKETAQECLAQMKPAEWSEEDEKMRDRIIDILNRTFSVYSALGTSSTRPSCPTYKDEIDWLKSLRPQPKQEWSEEDVDMLNSCISSIEEAKENRYAYKETDGDTSYDYEIAWLKSIRPSWKPSEEELVALKRVGSILRDYGHSELAKTVFMVEGKLANLSVVDKSIWKPSEEPDEPKYYQHFDPDC